MQTKLPYSRHFIEHSDIEAVIQVLGSEWLTTGPMVDAFEQAFAQFVGSRHAVAVSSGTAALHAAMNALGVGPSDEVIVPAITFVATANAVVFQGATPVFADVDPATLLVEPPSIEQRISARTKAIVSVDYAGQACDYDALRALSAKHNLRLVADACHALGGFYHAKPVGSLADLSTFSFHPSKVISSGEGGMISTDNDELAHKMRIFRNHGITTDHRRREQLGTWLYEMTELGFNYRLSDIQCALGLSQLKKLPARIGRRREIAARYDRALAEIPQLEPLHLVPGMVHAYHLYVVRVLGEQPALLRENLYSALRKAGISPNVHYLPVYLHPFYRKRFGFKPGLCPAAEDAYSRILSLPLFPSMSDEAVDYVVEVIRRHFALSNS